MHNVLAEFIMNSRPNGRDYGNPTERRRPMIWIHCDFRKKERAGHAYSSWIIWIQIHVRMKEYMMIWWCSSHHTCSKTVSPFERQTSRSWFSLLGRFSLNLPANSKFSNPTRPQPYYLVADGLSFRPNRRVSKITFVKFRTANSTYAGFCGDILIIQRCSSQHIVLPWRLFQKRESTAHILCFYLISFRILAQSEDFRRRLDYSHARHVSQFISEEWFQNHVIWKCSFELPSINSAHRRWCEHVMMIRRLMSPHIIQLCKSFQKDEGAAPYLCPCAFSYEFPYER